MRIKFLNKLAIVKKTDLKKLWIWARNFPFFSLFLTIYAILFFLNNNIAQVDYHAADRLLIVFSAITLLLLFIVWLVMRDIQRAGLVVFVVGFIFFSYPHVKIALQANLPILVRNSFLLPANAIFLAGSILAAIKASREKIAVLTLFLNATTTFLVLIPLTLIFVHEFRMAAYWHDANLQAPEYSAGVNTGKGSLPDVYFIVLDGYARADVLQDELNLDNSDFIEALRGRHFFVADCSMSNYAQTEQSFASTLNMTYIDEMVSKIADKNLREEYLAPYIKNSLVRQYFESIGYQTVSFYTGYSWGQWTNATYFLGDPRASNTNVTRLIPFESSFLSLTLYRYLPDVLEHMGIAKIPQITKLAGRDADRAIVRYTLDELPVVAQLRSPKLVFAHILLPHPPYVFGPNGEEQDLSTNITNTTLLLQGYRDQVLYANKRILPIIDTILAESKGDVIIVLEGDHGIIEYTSPAEHMKNLNAYYFPDHDYSDLYPWITPVNSFRVILSDFFGQNYPLLKDQTYFSGDSADKTFDFIPNPCAGK